MAIVKNDLFIKADEEQINRDFKKLEWLEENDYNLIEINYDEINLLSKEFFKKKFKVVL